MLSLSRCLENLRFYDFNKRNSRFYPGFHFSKNLDSDCILAVVPFIFPFPGTKSNANQRFCVLHTWLTAAVYCYSCDLLCIFIVYYARKWPRTQK